MKAGLAINPDTEWEVVKPFMNQLDLILVMSVHPGFGGQNFIPTALDKKIFNEGIKLSNLDLPSNAGLEEARKKN